MCMPMTPSDGDHHGEEDAGHHPQHLPLIARALAQKSIRITRMPLSAWYSTAATRPISIRPTIGDLVGLDDLVVGLRADAHQRGVEHVDEEEEEDRRAR